MRVAGIKLINFGGGAGGKRNGSGDHENEMTKIGCGCDQFYIFEKVKECVGKGTMEMSLKDFDEELCWGFSRVYEDWQMIQ